MRETESFGPTWTTRRVVLSSLSGLGPVCLFTARSQAKDITFGVVIPDHGAPYYDEMFAGIDATASKLQMVRKFLGRYEGPEQAVACFLNAVDLGLSGILLATDEEIGQIFVPALRQAHNAGIAVVIIGQDVGSGTAVILTDLDAVGRLQASLLPTSGGTVIFLTIPGAAWASDLEHRFAANVDLKRVKIAIVPVVSYSTQEARTRTEAVLQAEGNVVAVVAVSDILALGALKAVQRSGKHIKVIGFNATPEGRVATGTAGFFFTITLKPELQGARAVETLHGLIENGACPNGQNPPCPPQKVTPELVSAQK